jgi:hypothetical protein
MGRGGIRTTWIASQGVLAAMQARLVVRDALAQVELAG